MRGHEVKYSRKGKAQRVFSYTILPAGGELFLKRSKWNGGSDVVRLIFLVAERRKWSRNARREDEE